MRWLLRISIVIAFSLAATLGAAWLPGSLFDTERGRLTVGGRLATPGESAADVPVAIAVLVRVSRWADWYYLRASRNVEMELRSPLRSPQWPEFIPGGWTGKQALSRLMARLRTNTVDTPTHVSLGLIEHKGWPMRCLWCEHDLTEFWRPPPKPVGAIVLGSTRTLPISVWGSPMTAPRVLPYRPIWAGLAVNLVFWSAVAAPLVLGPRVFRRFVRRSRGACPACGYDLAGLAPGAACPECGKAQEVLV